MAFSVDPPEKAERMRRATEADFEFLSDAEGELVDRFGLRDANRAPGGGDLAQSASFLLDASGRVAWLKVAENYRVRPQPSEILAAARKLLQR